MKDLAERIYGFLNKYASVNPNWDPHDEYDEAKYTSPDAHQLEACADLLSQGEKPTRCWSEWGSGGYHPYSSSEGREEHDQLLKEIHTIINGK